MLRLFRPTLDRRTAVDTLSEVGTQPSMSQISQYRSHHELESIDVDGRSFADSEEPRARVEVCVGEEVHETPREEKWRWEVWVIGGLGEGKWCAGCSRWHNIAVTKRVGGTKKQADATARTFHGAIIAMGDAKVQPLARFHLGARRACIPAAAS
jgi:hypothetical protein